MGDENLKSVLKIFISNLLALKVSNELIDLHVYTTLTVPLARSNFSLDQSFICQEL